MSGTKGVHSSRKIAFAYLKSDIERAPSFSHGFSIFDSRLVPAFLITHYINKLFKALKYAKSHKK